MFLIGLTSAAQGLTLKNIQYGKNYNIQNTAYRYGRAHKERDEGACRSVWRDSESERQKILDSQVARQIRAQNLAIGIRGDRKRDFRALHMLLEKTFIRERQADNGRRENNGNGT